MSSDPTCNTRFTAVPLKALSDQVFIRYPCFCFFKLLIFNCGFSSKLICAFLAYKKPWRLEKLLELTLFYSGKQGIVQSFRSLEVTLSVPLNLNLFQLIQLQVNPYFEVK